MNVNIKSLMFFWVMGVVMGCGRDPSFVEREFSGSADAQGSGEKDPNSSAKGDVDPYDKLDPETKSKLKRLPKFGLLVNDPECGFCHVEVRGDQVSTRTVPPLWTGSTVHVEGQWLVAADFNANDPVCGDAKSTCLGANVTVSTSEGLTEGYQGKKLPKDRDQDGAPDFPELDMKEIKGLVNGSLQATLPATKIIHKIHKGNLILIGTTAKPIQLNGDIFVTGDLVIKGVYRGIGSIYVQGNIYIPADLYAGNSAFPFPDDREQALKVAEKLVKKGQTDGLGLATQGSIFIGDLGKQQNSDAVNENLTIYNHPSAPTNRLGPALGVYRIFNWYPGGKAGYDILYEKAVSCLTGAATQTGSFNKIEAFLYAKNTVAGVTRRASFTIRGGIIADYLHVISGAVHCDGTLGQLSEGRPTNKNYIDYDYRLATGRFRILEHLGTHFSE